MRSESRAQTVATLDPTYAALALDDAADREQVFEVLLRAARSVCEVAALVSVHADHLRGRRGLAAEGFDVRHVGELRLHRGVVPAFEAAIASAQPSVGALATGEPFVDGLLEQLGGATPSALVLPIAIGSRVVALVVAHRGSDPLALADVSELFPLVAASGVALARILAARPKVAPAPAPRPPRSDTAYEVEIVVPDAAKQRAVLTALRERGAWDELAVALRELIGEGIEHGDPDEDEQLELLLELGRLEADRLGSPDRAIEAWRMAQTIDAADARVLDAMQALFVAQGRWAECADLLEKRTALADTPAARIPLLLELAALARERLDDDERAIAAYERILNWEPQHAMATRELEAIYSAREQWEPLAALLLDRVSQDPQHGASELETVAQMYEDKVGDLRAALLVWLAVVRREPEHPRALEEIARLAPSANAWDELVAEGAALAEELEAAHPVVAARVWHLVGTWRRDHLGNRDGAAQAFEQAARLAPHDTSAVLALDGILRAEGRWIDLAALLLQRADQEADVHRRGELLAELGDLYEHYLGQPEDALACYERARADDPEARGVLLALRRLYRRNSAWSALAELLRALIDLHDPATERAELVDLHVELAGVLAEQLARPEDAVRELRAALELEPQHPPAFRALAAVYQATGQTDALLDATEDAVDAAPRAEQLQRYAEVAQGWHDRGRFDRAAACWQKLIALEPTRLTAHEGLAAALRRDEQWSALATELRARLELVADGAPRAAILLELAELLDTKLDEPDAAVAAYDGVLAIDPKHRGVLDALARLHDRAGRLPPAIAALQRLLELTTTETAARADVFQRLGQAYLNARDVPAARLHLKQALGLDLANAGAHEGMARLHLMQDEAVAAGEELVRAAELSTDPHERIRRLADAAWVFRHRLRDTERARQCLHLILDLEPEHGDAKLALAELLHDSKQWEMLWPHLEQEVARANADASLPAAERTDIYTRAARCALELDNFAAALELYDAAAALDTGVALQIERAEALVRSKSLDAAAAALQTIVLRHAQSLERTQLVQIYRRLGELHTTLGKPSQAQLFYQKVLELEPHDAATLRSLADLHTGRGRFDEAIASLRTLAGSVEPAERVSLLERIGDIYRDKLKNAPRATSTYLEALELAPGNHRLLQRLLDLQSEQGQWKSALETIERFLAHETDPVRRGAYHIASAEIRRNELRDKAGALDAYEHALDELFAQQPPTDAARARGLDTFRIVDEMLTAERNWTRQEQSYRRMIKRIAKDDPALVALWHALGEVYRTRLRKHESAIEAFEVAHALDPDKSAERASILAELYALAGKRRPQEVPQRAAKLVETAPTNPDAYRALGKTVAEAGGIDQAWCVARALVVLKQASPDEAALYKRYQANEVRKATGILDEEAWAHVRHADEDRAISAVFSLIWDGPVALRAGPAKAFDLKPKERMPVEDGTRVLAKIFRHAARVLNVGLPDVYVQPRRSGRLLLANCIERGRLVPAVIVGRDLMTGYRDTEIASAVGAMLALLRPAYYLKLALTSVEELEAALGAAAQLVHHPWVGRAELEPLRSAFATEIQKRLDRRRGEALVSLVGRLPERPDLARWRDAVDAAAQRAGLLVSGELAAATRMLATEASPLGGARPGQRVQDLVSYSVSPSYFTVRGHLGVTVG